MLSLLEDCVKSFAKVLKHKQLIIIEARQVEVVFFSLKNHYLPERMEDRKRLKMLFSGNKEEIFITTASGYTNDGGELPGFIYSKKHLLGLLKHYNDNEDNSYKINDIFNNERELDKLFFRDPAEHIGNGFTIKFIKTIT